ncbi:transient receptor potential protein-like [Artemia franciscana]|uniref:Transient receptor ion channel domain-containing protein n=1 Tax=Artemia franciscana TaxID=6661 RepID=A0AA88HQJ3_ARTSF|nr:hypothetical protein QYM36_010626 [Artemia franciscana]KAK2716109.1 hypothetical protein QYM36_010626 [Artemia franciscana]KAK2716110.1 hypothetical protein QYM36_010626 [Artemia franciscana]
MKATESKEFLVGSGDGVSITASEVMGPPVEAILTNEEKRFLLFVERGDVAGCRELLKEMKDQPDKLSINCTDPLGRSSLVIAIENENFELMEVLLEFGIQVQDSLLHAISEEYVEGVELLLEWEEANHTEGTPYSWEAVDKDTATFTPDITPLVLAAHKDNYEILKILLDRGASLPMPHDVRCGCDECSQSMQEDSLRHSRSRINAYKALASPSLIALSSKDPILTAFELCAELTRLANVEAEFSADYFDLARRTEAFATELLDHARTSRELEIILNFSPGQSWEPGDRQTLDRLKLAIKRDQKQFVAHPNVQQLLGTIWYEGLPGIRRKGLVGQIVQMATLACQFPLYATIHMIAPNSEKAAFSKKPFPKFLFHSASYLFFLSLLAMASQRLEYVLIEWFGPEWIKEMMYEWQRKERGSLPGPVECLIIFWVFGLIWAEIKSLWNDGLIEYITDLWNIVDFITNVFFTAWILLRATAWFVVQRELWQGKDPWYPREEWDAFDPMLISEGAFSAAMVFSFLKLVHVFSISPHLGPLQISLGRMVIDIIKFFFIYMLVLFAFGCGLNQLLWYYADLTRKQCYKLPDGEADWENEEIACFFWRRFSNLFETSQSLFWASFGLVDLMAFELDGIKGFTRFWGLLMFGSYSTINIIVLLNLLIAMMSNSYQAIQGQSDTEWKFARTQLWLSYFEEGATVPPPFNTFPTPKGMLRVLGIGKERMTGSVKNKCRMRTEIRHMKVMRSVIRRYVASVQARNDEQGVTEDDINEVKQDISSFRYELIDILKKSGMDTSGASAAEKNAVGKKGRVRERRLMKNFQIGMVEDVINDIISRDSRPKDIFGKIARAIGNSTTKRTDWNAVSRRFSKKRNPIGRSETSLKRASQQSLRRKTVEEANNILLRMNAEELADYNPRLKEYTPATRIAYAKFKGRATNNVTIINETSRKSSIADLKSSVVDLQKSLKEAKASAQQLPGRKEEKTDDTAKKAENGALKNSNESNTRENSNQVNTNTQSIAEEKEAVPKVVTSQSSEKPTQNLDSKENSQPITSTIDPPFTSHSSGVTAAEKPAVCSGASTIATPRPIVPTSEPKPGALAPPPTTRSPSPNPAPSQRASSSTGSYGTAGKSKMTGQPKTGWL